MHAFLCWLIKLKFRRQPLPSLCQLFVPFLHVRAVKGQVCPRNRPCLHEVDVGTGIDGASVVVSIRLLHVNKSTGAKFKGLDSDDGFLCKLVKLKNDNRLNEAEVTISK